MTAPHAGRGTGPDDNFGHLVSHRPAVVHQPGDPEEPAASRPTVVARAEGHSTFGQAQSAGGVLRLVSPFERPAGGTVHFGQFRPPVESAKRSCAVAGGN